jgi:hypothetical protein
MRPLAISHFHAADFGDTVSCLGRQLCRVIQTASDLLPAAHWYVADVRLTGARAEDWEPRVPIRIADTAQMLARIAQIQQFESGVFAAVPTEILTPVFRDQELWTDDEDVADLGDAVIEIRAFDTSYISVASADTRLIQRIKDALLGDAHVFAR